VGEQGGGEGVALESLVTAAIELKLDGTRALDAAAGGIAKRAAQVTLPLG
jgi:hypothetical protein